MPGYPTATGHPNHSGTYIPLLFATLLLVEFYAATIFGAIATTEHEDELQKFGDTLRIRTLPEIVSRDYVKGQKLQYQTPEGGFIDLVIDKGKYWGVGINAVDKKQIDIPYVQKWAEHASMKQKVAIDTDVLGRVYAEADAHNKGATAGKVSGDFNLGASGSPLALTKDNIIDNIIDWGVVLDEQNVPDEERWVALPSWACGLLKKSDLKDASMTGDGKSLLRNGRLGMIDRFEVFRTNNLSVVADGAYSATNAMFGHKMAIAFASQMMMTETLKNPDDFGEIVRSLQVYGDKVQKPGALGTPYIRKG
jgi:hypothetical protein